MIKARPLALAALIVGAFMIGGCSASPSPTSEQGSPSTAPSSATLGTATFSLPPARETPGETTAVPTPAATATPLIPGVALITLTTALSGGGTRPQLAWQPVDGAAMYRVAVFDENGRPYWTWEGSIPTAFFGGGAQPLPDEAPGPRLREGMSWVVFAADDSDRPIAASAITPLSP